jgi:hypothetical protein
MKVKCPSCCEIYLETTKDFDPDKIASGPMFRLIEKYGPQGYNWSMPFGEYDMAEGIGCPGCGMPIVDLNGKVNPGNLIKDAQAREEKIEFEANLVPGDRKAYPLHQLAQPQTAHVCPECGKLCKNTLGLNSHMRSHGKRADDALSDADTSGARGNTLTPSAESK